MGMVAAEQHLGWSSVLRVAERGIPENEKCWDTIPWEVTKDSQIGYSATRSPKTQAWAEHVAMPRCCRHVRC